MKNAQTVKLKENVSFESGVGLKFYFIFMHFDQITPALYPKKKKNPLKTFILFRSQKSHSLLIKKKKHIQSKLLSHIHQWLA